MSNKALDLKTNMEVLAKHATSKVHYKCLNKKCSAVMVLRRGVTPCFTAIKSHPHIDGCDEANSSSTTKSTLPLGFTIDSFIHSLSSLQTASVTARACDSTNRKNVAFGSTVSTPKQLYDYCQAHCDLYDKICIDGDNSANVLKGYSCAGVSGGKVMCGFISHYLPNDCLVVKISSKTQGNHPLLIKLEMNPSVYGTVKQILLHRAHKIQEAKVIVCAQCVPEHTIAPYFKTNTTARIESSQQLHVYLE